MIAISRFSGKCDFYDDICIFGLERILKAKVFIGNSDKPLQLNTYKDCIPYFPYVATIVGYNKEGTDFIRLTPKSWVDMQAEKYGDKYTLNDYYKNELQKEMKKYEEELI